MQEWKKWIWMTAVLMLTCGVCIGQDGTNPDGHDEDCCETIEFAYELPADTILQCSQPIPASMFEAEGCGVDFEIIGEEYDCEADVLIRHIAIFDECDNWVEVSHRIIFTNVVSGIVWENLPDEEFVSLECDEDIPDAPFPTATYRCRDLKIEFLEETAGSACSNGLSITRRWVAIDEWCEGEVDSFTQIISIAAAGLPEVDFEGNEPTDTEVECMGDITEPPVPVVKSCVSAWVNGPDKQYNCETRTMTYTWTPEDICGRKGEPFVWTITLVGENGGNGEWIDVPDDVTYSCTNDVPPAATPTYVTPCEIYTPDYEEERIGDQCEGMTITRTWTLPEVCGLNSNITVMTQVITVDPEDGNIELDCAGEITLICEDGAGEAPMPDLTGNYGPDKFPNSCSGITVTQSPVAGEILEIGEYPGQLIATDKCGNAVTCHFNIVVTCLPSDDESGDSDIGNESVDVRLYMGWAADGRSAGLLQLYAATPSWNLGTPRALNYLATLNNTEVIRQTNGDLNQIKTDQALADVVVLTTNSYEVRFYTAKDIGGKGDDGLYQCEEATAFVVYRFSMPRDVNVLLLEEIRGNDITQHEYTYNESTLGWTLNQGNGRRMVTRESQWLDANQIFREEVHTISNAAGQLALKEIITYQQFPWGEEKVFLTQYPNEDYSVVTEWAYYTDPAEAGRYMRIAREVRADGKTIDYDYDNKGRQISKTMTFASDSGWNRVETYSYEPVDEADEGDVIYAYLPRTTTVTETGIVVSKTYAAHYAADDGGRIQIQEKAVNQTSEYGDIGNVRTTRTYYPKSSGPESERLKTVEQPDGRLETYTYERGIYTPLRQAPGRFNATTNAKGNAIRQMVTHGTVDFPDGIFQKTTREVSIRDAFGNEVLTQTEVYTGNGYERVDWTVNEFDSRGRVVATYFANGASRSSVWGTRGKVMDVDVDGSVTHYIMDTLGRVSQVVKAGIEPSAHSPYQPDIVTHFIYDADGKILSETKTAGGLTMTVRSNGYDQGGGLIESINSAGLKTSYLPDYAAGTKTTVMPNGGIQIQTVEKDRLVSITGSAVTERHMSEGIYTNGYRWRVETTGPATNSLWRRTTTDLLGRTVQVEKHALDDGLVSTEYEYNSKGQLVAVYEKHGNALLSAPTLYEYDELGDVVRTIRDVNENGQVDLDGPDQVVENETYFIQQNNEWWQENVSRVYWDDPYNPERTATQRKRLSGSSCGCSAAETQTVDVFGNTTTTRAEIDSAMRRVTTIREVPHSVSNEVAVSVNGLLQSQTTAAGLTTTYQYDAFGRVIGVTDPRIGTSTTRYNERGQVAEMKDPSGNTTEYAYDPQSGLRTQVKNALGQIVYSAYDLQGRVTNTWGATYPVAYEYDAYGRLAAMKTWRNTNDAPDVTRWLYDIPTGLLTNKVYADGQGPSYQYDASGRLSRRTWARGVETDYSYDNLGQLLGMDYTDDTPAVSFTYDRLGRQSTITDILGTRTNVYDGIARHSGERLPNGDVLSRSYDAFGRASGFNLNSNSISVDYAYDALGRLTSVHFPNGSEEARADYAYLENSSLISGWRISNDQLGDDLVVSRTYDPHRNLLESITNRIDGGASISTFHYQNDAIGRRTKRLDDGTKTNTFSYNARNELTHSWIVTNYFGYLYDDIGNRKRSTQSSRFLFYTNNALNQHVSVGATNYIYDADGNLVNDKKWVYTWDGENRLISCRQTGKVTYPVRINFEYDYMGRMVSRHYERQLRPDTRDARTYVYDGWNRILERKLVGREPVLQNASFETDLSGWTTSNVTWMDTGRARLNNSGSFVEQTLDLPAGRYVVRFRYHPSNGGQAPGYGSYPYAFRATLGNVSSNITGYYASWSTWYGMQDYEMQLTVTTPVDRIRFEVPSGIPNAMLDDISLERLPDETIYVWGLDLSGTLQGAGGVGGLLAERRAADVDADTAWRFPLYDGNGNITDWINSRWEHIAHHEYDPFGNETTGNPPTSFGFSTKSLDGTLGLYYYGYRFYSPSLGRWLNRDPIRDVAFLIQHFRDYEPDKLMLVAGSSPEALQLFRSEKFLQGLNLSSETWRHIHTMQMGRSPLALHYAFCHNAPLDHFDPHGDIAPALAGCLAGGVVGGIGGAIGGWLSGGFSVKSCLCGAFGGAVGGCITGGVCAGVPSLCVAAGCIGGFLGSIANQLCMEGTALDDPCKVAAAIISTGLGCLGGGGLSEVEAKEKLILWLLNLDIESLNSLCGLSL